MKTTPRQTRSVDQLHSGPAAPAAAGQFWRQAWRRICLLGVVGVLSACSAVQLGYLNSAHLTQWWLNKYFQFNSVQADWVKEQLNESLVWHRSQGLPIWVDTFEQWAKEVPQDTTTEIMCRDIDTLKVQADAVFQHLVPMWTQLALNLEPKQITRLERELAESNEDYVNERMASDPQERLAARLEAAVERSERLYGRITDAQERLLKAQLQTSPYTAEQDYARRLATQKNLIDLIRTQQERWGRSTQIGAPPPEAAIQEWRALWQTFLYPAQHWPDLEVRERQAKVEQATCDIFATLHNATDATQRAHWAEVLVGIADDLRGEILSAPAQ